MVDIESCRKMEKRHCEEMDSLIRERNLYKFELRKLEKIKKREFNVLLKAIQSLNKQIIPLKRQVLFLNELLDKKDQELREIEKGRPQC